MDGEAGGDELCSKPPHGTRSAASPLPPPPHVKAPRPPLQEQALIDSPSFRGGLSQHRGYGAAPASLGTRLGRVDVYTHYDSSGDDLSPHSSLLSTLPIGEVVTRWCPEPSFRARAPRPSNPRDPSPHSRAPSPSTAAVSFRTAHSVGASSTSLSEACIDALIGDSRGEMGWLPPLGDEGPGASEAAVCPPLPQAAPTADRQEVAAGRQAVGVPCGVELSVPVGEEEAVKPAKAAVIALTDDTCRADSGSPGRISAAQDSSAMISRVLLPPPEVPRKAPQRIASLHELRNELAEWRPDDPTSPHPLPPPLCDLRGDVGKRDDAVTKETTGVALSVFQSDETVGRRAPDEGEEAPPRAEGATQQMAAELWETSDMFQDLQAQILRCGGPPPQLGLAPVRPGVDVKSQPAKKQALSLHVWLEEERELAAMSLWDANCHPPPPPAAGDFAEAIKSLRAHNYALKATIRTLEDQVEDAASAAAAAPPPPVVHKEPPPPAADEGDSDGVSEGFTARQSLAEAHARIEELQEALADINDALEEEAARDGEAERSLVASVAAAVQRCNYLEEELAEVEAEVATVQSAVHELQLENAGLERDRAALTQREIMLSTTNAALVSRAMELQREAAERRRVDAAALGAKDKTGEGGVTQHPAACSVSLEEHEAVLKALINNERKLSQLQRHEDDARGALRASLDVRNRLERKLQAIEDCVAGGGAGIGILGV